MNKDEYDSSEYNKEENVNIDNNNNNNDDNDDNNNNDNNDKKERSSTVNSTSSKKEYYVSVYNPVTTEGVSGFTVYSVETSISKKTVLKRYSEFYNFRKKLTQRWPGIYVPALPEKKVIGNKDNKFIETRCKLLELFLKKLLYLKHFRKSEELKIFLSESNNVEVILEKLSSKSEEEIMIRYKSAFVNLIGEKMLPENSEEFKRIDLFSQQLQSKVLRTLKVMYFI